MKRKVLNDPSSHSDNQDTLDITDQLGADLLMILDDQVKTVGGTVKAFASDICRKCIRHTFVIEGLSRQNFNKIFASFNWSVTQGLFNF